MASITSATASGNLNTAVANYSSGLALMKQSGMDTDIFASLSNDSSTCEAYTLYGSLAKLGRINNLTSSEYKKYISLGETDTGSSLSDLTGSLTTLQQINTLSSKDFTYLQDMNSSSTDSASTSNVGSLLDILG